MVRFELGWVSTQSGIPKVRTRDQGMTLPHCLNYSLKSCLTKWDWFGNQALINAQHCATSKCRRELDQTMPMIPSKQ